MGREGEGKMNFLGEFNPLVHFPQRSQGVKHFKNETRKEK